MSTSDNTAAATSDASLYERVGGRPGIEAIVASIWNNHVSNPLINRRYADSDPDNVKRLVT